MIEEKRPSIKKALLIYSDGQIIEITYKELLKNKNKLDVGLLFSGLCWTGMEALGLLKRKEMGLA